jgi:hypothetical protein
MKHMDRMGENPPWLYQGVGEPLGLSRTGRSVPVSSMPLKGTGEARGKPPRGPAWLRDRMVSQTKWISAYGERVPCLILPEGTATVVRFTPV